MLPKFFVLTAYLIDTPQRLWVKACLVACILSLSYSFQVAGVPPQLFRLQRSSVGEARFTPGRARTVCGLVRPCGRLDQIFTA